MRRSLWLPIALAAVLMLLVVTAQLGVTAANLDQGLNVGLRWVRALGAPLVAAAACVAWIRTRERALGFYTVGMAAMPLTGLANRLVWPMAGLWLYPFALIGMALAAITWVPATQRSRRPVIVLLLVITAAIVFLEELIMASPGLWDMQSLPTAVNSLHPLYWVVLAMVAWHGHRQAGIRPLLWLGLQGAFSALSALLFLAEVLLTPRMPLLPGWCSAILVTVPLVMAAGVVVTAGSHRASLFR